MNYIEKYNKIVSAISDSIPFVVNDEPLKLKLTSENGLKYIDLDEIESILYKLEKDQKLKLIAKPVGYPGNEFDVYLDYKPYYELEILDKGSFNHTGTKGLVATAVEVRENTKEIPMAGPGYLMRSIIDSLSGTTLEERTRLQAIRDSYPKSATHTEDKYFIVYKDDRIIRLNGKIDIGKPPFGSNSEALFLFLYNNPNKTFSRKDIENQIKVELRDSITKMLESIGFRRGLRTAFFDIRKSKVADNETVKFKKSITL